MKSLPIHPNAIAVRAIQWLPKQKSKHVIAEIGVGGQCCYADGPSALVTIKTNDAQIEMQLSADDCKKLADRLLADGISWAKTESFTQEDLANQ